MCLVSNWFKFSLNLVWTKTNHLSLVWTELVLSLNQNIDQTLSKLSLDWTEGFFKQFLSKMIKTLYLTYILTILIDYVLRQSSWTVLIGFNPVWTVWSSFNQFDLVSVQFGQILISSVSSLAKRAPNQTKSNFPITNHCHHCCHCYQVFIV